MKPIHKIAMKSTLLVTVLFIVTLSGCKSSRPMPESSVQYPVRISAFPPPIEQTRLREITIDIVLLVETDGRVSDALIVGPGLSSSWNAIAIDSVKTWRFSALTNTDKTEPTWYRRSVRVLFQDPTILPLAEIEMTSAEIADSVHQVLRNSFNFEAFVRENQLHPDIRIKIDDETDLSQFPEFLRFELQSLRPERFTRPINLDGKFYIYRRAANTEPPA
jgi:hypothetical protein